MNVIEYTPLVFKKGRFRPISGTKEYKKWRYYNFYRDPSIKTKEPSNLTYNEYMRIYNKCRRAEDLQFKLAYNLRIRLRKYTKGLGFKRGSAIVDLGCDLNTFINHIESKFNNGMSWANYGQGKNKWSIDHIIALSEVNLTDIVEFKKVNHYSNLRPLWNKDQVKTYHNEQKSQAKK